MKRMVCLLMLSVFVAGSAAGQFPVNVAPSATWSTAYEVGGGRPNPENMYNGNVFIANSFDFKEWAAFGWDTPQPLTYLIVQQMPGSVVGAYEIQIATTPNPDPSSSADWITVKTFGSVQNPLLPSAVSGNGIDVSGYGDIYGVRFEVLSYGSIQDELGRINEIFAYTKYDNVMQSSKLKNIVAPTWTNLPLSAFTDECLLEPIESGYELYNPSVDTAVYINFHEPVTLGSSCLFSGWRDEDYLIDYTIAYWDDELNKWITVLTVTGNTTKMDERIFTKVGTSDQWRINITDADPLNPGSARISEIMLFETTIPEPATMTLLALGGLALRRRRK